VLDAESRLRAAERALRALGKRPGVRLASPAPISSEPVAPGCRDPGIHRGPRSGSHL